MRASALINLITGWKPVLPKPVLPKPVPPTRGELDDCCWGKDEYYV